jgi:hypothetical protein
MNALVQTPFTGSLGPAIVPPTQLPDQSRALDAARFQQLMVQATDQQAAVEFTNPASSSAAPVMNAALQSIGSSSRTYLDGVNAGLKAVSTLDMNDPKSIGKLIERLTATQVQGLQLSMMLSEVSNSKRSLQTLFQNQG